MIFAISISLLMITTVYATRGKVTGGGQIRVGEGKASFGFNAMQFSRDAGPKGELQYIDHNTGMKVHAHELDYLEVYGVSPGNKPSELLTAMFYGPCKVNNVDGYRVQILVNDRGEPGTADFFRIGVWDSSSVGYEYADAIYWEDAFPEHKILHGNIQTHKVPK